MLLNRSFWSWYQWPRGVDHQRIPFGELSIWQVIELGPSRPLKMTILGLIPLLFMVIRAGSALLDPKNLLIILFVYLIVVTPIWLFLALIIWPEIGKERKNLETPN